MKAALHENHLDCYAEVYAGQKEIEVTGESVVSDKLPDIGLLGETTANVILRGKRVDNAMGILEGDLQATVCYLPDGASGFCSLEINVPWQISFESEFLTDRSVLVGEVTVQQLETRLINPRKVLVKAQLCGNFSAYEKQSLTVCDEMEDDGLVQVRRETLACSLIGTVCEKTFVATDEYPLPAHLVGGSLLSRGHSFG